LHVVTGDDPMAASREAYSRRARAARIEQGLPQAIEDADTLAYLADVLSAPADRVSQPSQTKHTAA
jgi:hypothetical protein